MINSYDYNLITEIFKGHRDINKFYTYAITQVTEENLKYGEKMDKYTHWKLKDRIIRVINSIEKNKRVYTKNVTTRLNFFAYTQEEAEFIGCIIFYSTQIIHHPGTPFTDIITNKEYMEEIEFILHREIPKEFINGIIKKVEKRHIIF